MKLSCADIQNLTSRYQLFTSCDQIRNGMLRLATPFLYPNGSQIDLFFGTCPNPALRLQESPQLGFFSNQGYGSDSFVLTDLGQTTEFLLEMQINATSTEARRDIVTNVCSLFNVEHENGEFLIRFESRELNQLSDIIFRLSQACIRIADLVYTFYPRRQSTFRDDVAEILERSNLKVDRNVPFLMGHKRIKVDFRVHGKRHLSLVNTLTTVNRNKAHDVANDVFVRWYDLGKFQAKDAQPFFTVYDSQAQLFHPSGGDLQRISEVSRIFGLPDQEQEFIKELAA